MAKSFGIVFDSTPDAIALHRDRVINYINQLRFNWNEIRNELINPIYKKGYPLVTGYE